MSDKRPNILLLMGDDIGWWNISYNNRGQMGYRTPNIDRIANEGVAFTDYYGQQSCTAGRAAFITGQNPVRTGLTKVGAPGAQLGLMEEDPTIADLLKPLGYATGQFGKNHFGDRNVYLPTVHGFDEFFGNLYHLNAEDEPENPDYPKDPKFRLTIGPRGVIHSWATDKDDPTEQPRWGRVGRQRIEDTGPLTKKRMETCDEEFTGAALDFIDRAHKADQPFFIWWNSTAMHCFTHRADKHAGKSGQGFYNDVMVAHDENVGKLLAKLDELGIAGDTIVVYTTDNGPHYNTWPDAGITPFRSEKNTNWEGGWRVPAFVRWPGRFKAGTVINGIVCHQDWLPTLLAAAGEPDINAKLLKGHQAGDKTFKVHIDGFNMLPHFTGQANESPRKFFAYVNDDGAMVAARTGDWKIVFEEQRAKQMLCWAEPFVHLRLPKIFHLRRDPFERADTDSNGYWNWLLERTFVIGGAQAMVAQMLQSFVDFPPRQKPGSFNLDGVLERMKDAAGGGHH
jgi:arylsulfatase A-like enzyme